MRNMHIPAIDTVDKVIKLKITDIMLIKDIIKLVSPSRGIEIPKIVGGASTSDMPASDISVFSSSIPPASA